MNTLIHRLYFKIVLPVLQSLPFTSERFGPVRNQTSSIIQAMNDDLRTNHFHQTSIEIRNHDPITAIPAFPLRLMTSSIHRIPELFVIELENARIATKVFDTIGHPDVVFEDLYYGNITGMQGNIFSRVLPKLPRLVRKDFSAVNILTSRAMNYYHWMNDCLPRLWLLENAVSDDYKLVVPANMIPFQKQSLELMGISHDRLLPFGHEHWRLQSVIVPSLINEASQTNPEASRWLSRKLVSAIRPDPSKYGPRIFISRKNAEKRRLLNEEEIVAIVTSHGFAVVHNEELTLEEQIRTFQQAECVIASHGAGLTNIMFMKEGSFVIELLPYNRVKPCYFSMASAMNLHYSCVSNAPERANENAWVKDTDFAIPPERLERALSQLNLLDYP